MPTRSAYQVQDTGCVIGSRWSIHAQFMGASDVYEVLVHDRVFPGVELRALHAYLTAAR